MRRPDRERVHAAIEHGLDQFDGFGCAALPPGVEVAADLRADAMDRRILILYRRAERQVGDYFPHRDRQRAADTVDANRYGAGGAADAGGAKFQVRIDADRAEQVAT